MEANEACSPEGNTSTNITADEIDEDTAKKLRGDAIGNTMYSEVFVLNTLMQFSELKWTKEVENNLCFLWDMTEEKDVSQYLLQASYPRLACSAIENYTEPRFIEIVVGIFANLLCCKCEKNVTEDEIKIVLNLLNSNDPYILIQVMRFIQALAVFVNKWDFFGEEHVDRFHFILCNSTNKELVSIALKALVAITEGMKIKEEVLRGDLLMAVITGYRSLKDDSEDEMFEVQEKHVNAKYLVSFLCNVCGYVDTLGRERLGQEVAPILSEFTSEVVILLHYYKSEGSLLPIDEEFRFYMEALTYIYRILKVSYISLVAQYLYEIFAIIYKKDRANLELVTELFCYFIGVGDLAVFQKDFESVSSDEVKEILSYIERNNFEFEFVYIDKLRIILKEL